MGDPSAGGPVDAAGIPLARRDYPVTLPKVGNAVATATKPESGGELQIYNYADYINPEVIKAFGKQENVSVRVTTFNSLDEAFTKLSTGRLKFDVIFSAPDHLAPAGRAQADPAAELRPDPEPARRGLAGAASPFYDVGPRYSVPYTVYTTGIGWRNDKLGTSIRPSSGWESFWDPGVGVQGPRGRARRLARGARDGADAARPHRPQHREPGAAAARVDDLKSSTTR